jgi:ABC-type multidrug transport system ATPase subunit
MLAVSIQGISKSYFGKSVLDQVSFDLEAGKFYALIGENGSGKSTLLRILRRLEAPDKGDGTVVGFRLSEDDAAFGADVGYASESVNLPFATPLEKFFRDIRDFYPRWDQTLLDQIISEYRFDLKSRFGQLSRGQRMQILFAYCMAIRPKLLILDEVTSVLDSRVRPLILERCKNFVEAGGTVLMATNLVFEVRGFAQKTIYLERNHVRVEDMSNG